MEHPILPTVVLVGRVNVGKSSLFNRLTETEKALVSNIPGTTRDFNQGITEWQGYQFSLVDTGGIDLSKPDDIEQEVFRVAWEKLEAADLVLLVVDSKDGLLASDERIAKQLRERGIGFAVVANKADSPKLRTQALEFTSLRGEVFPVSAVNGSGTGDLLDYIIAHVVPSGERPEYEPEQKDRIRITFAGLPNVGKSSLINALLGRKELIVSPQPHTTRESRDLAFTFDDTSMTFVDTAGIRKVRKLKGFLTRKSAEKTHDAINRSDWVIFVVDATQEKWGHQEKYILDSIVSSGASIVIAANKWDLLKSEDRFKEFQKRWARSFGYYRWIPIVPVSALNGWHARKLLEKVIELQANRSRVLPQSALDRLLKQAINIRRPQKRKGPEAPYIHKLKQVDAAPPTFEIVIDYSDTLAESYVRFIERLLREKFEFTGTPLRLYVRAIK